MWDVGQKIGDYELVANLRAGGMATLFLAQRVGAAGFRRDVAIKIVHPHLASDPQFQSMFLDEATLAARIQHPNVVHVEELSEVAGTHYMVMEYVHGCSLSQLNRELIGRGRRLSPAFAVRIAVQLAEALHAAHETCDERGRPLKVVHRDVSPENVLLAYSGHVKLIDFGIAKAYGRRHKTAEGLLKGKFRYMAPEQAYGRDVDRRTDIYQLGIVLWEMLTLRRLFDAETDVELMQQIREPKVRPAGQLVPGVPTALDNALLRALDPKPRKRPSSAQDFARMLSKAVPASAEVDSGALSALLSATMASHREKVKGSLPPGVFQRLETSLEVGEQQPAQARPGAAQQVMKRYTVQNTENIPGQAIRSAPPQGAARAAATNGVAPPSAQTQAGYQSPGHGQSERPAAASGPAAVGGAASSSAQPPERRRRLVHLATELKTTFTRIAEGNGELRVFWLLAGAAVGLAGAAAMVTMALRARSAEVTAVPPPPPAPPVLPAPEAPPSEPDQANPPPDQANPPPDQVAKPTTAKPAIQERTGDNGAEPAQRPKATRRSAARRPGRPTGAAPVMVDGTPLVVEGVYD